jgi:hypothetical protein
MRLINDSGYTKERIEQEFQDTFIDNEGILRWTTNLQIPFDDMLTDFRTLGLISEDVQLYSNLLREKETDEFWQSYFNKIEKETI